MHAELLRSCLALCDLVYYGLPSFSVRERGVSRQEYWSVLANTGCRSLLGYYISCFLSHQLPRVPGAARTLAALAAAPPPHLTLTGGKPKSSRASSEANPSGGPTHRGENKTTIETQGQCG